MRPRSRTCAPPLGGRGHCGGNTVDERGGLEAGSRTCLAFARAVASQRTRPAMVESGLDGMV